MERRSTAPLLGGTAHATLLSLEKSRRSGLCLWIRAQKARPSFQLQEEEGERQGGERFPPGAESRYLTWKFWTLTFL